MSASDLATGFGMQFPTASDAALLRLADAVVRQDVPAYEEAFVDVIREIGTYTVHKVENVKVTGDSATADVTATRQLGSEPAETKTKTFPYVKEDGEWRECDPPS